MTQVAWRLLSLMFCREPEPKKRPAESTMPTQESDKYLRQVIRISDEMLEVAYQGDACREDVGCGVVFGSVRDKAYKIRKLAEEELRTHEQKATEGGGANEPRRGSE